MMGKGGRWLVSLDVGTVLGGLVAGCMERA